MNWTSEQSDLVNFEPYLCQIEDVFVVPVAEDLLYRLVTVCTSSIQFFFKGSQEAKGQHMLINFRDPTTTNETR